MLLSFRRLWQNSLRALLFGLCLAPSGCIISTTTDPVPTEPSQKADPQADERTYAAKVAELESHRVELSVREMMYPYAVRSKLYYLDFTTYAPALRRYDPATKKFGKYDFSVGTGDDFNFEASESLIVTAEARTGTYRAYTTGAVNTLKGQTVLKDQDAKWGAYDVDGDDVYVVTADSAGTHTLYRWQPGSEPGSEPVAITTLESLGITTGEFHNVGVKGNLAYLLRGSSLWTLDLTTKKATRVQATTSVEAVDFQPPSLAFTTSRPNSHYTLNFLDLATQTQRDLSKELETSSYRLTQSHAISHHFDDEKQFTMYGNWLIYKAFSGIYAYHLENGTLIPILLEPRGNDGPSYNSPTVTEDGTLFVSSRNAVYTVNLNGDALFVDY